MTQIEDRVRSGLRAEAEAVARVGTAAESTTYDRSRVPLSGAGVAAVMAVVVLVVFGGIALINSGFGDVANDPLPNPSSVPVVGDPDRPFQGTWISTSDADGGTQTMTVVVSADDAVEVVVLDTIATVCSGAPSTMTGTGRIEAGTRVVIPEPVYTCDDGSQPETLSGPPLEEQLRNLTFVLGTQADTVTDSLGSVWRREGAEASSPEMIATGMWPQSNLEEVQEAQELADAGDPDSTWQLGTQLTLDDPWAHVGELELVDRFLREVLGWEAYLFNGVESVDDDGWVDGVLTDQRFLRCVPGRTNPLYPPQPDSLLGESCAPTIDDLNYESVSLDLAQLDRQGPDGIWVVSRWGMTAPFAQADPAVVEEEAAERLEEFLAARIAGQGAEGYVQVYSDNFGEDLGLDVPLLYATTSGAPYERYEIERVDRPQWPDGDMTFLVRLFTDGGATVVEHQISWEAWWREFWLSVGATTENGQPVTVSYTSSDGEVAVSAPSTWSTWSGGGANHSLAPGVWFWELYRDEDRIEFTDPAAYDAWCAANGGSPLLTAPAGADAIAQKLIADPNFDTTAPVAALVGGVEAVSIDVALAPGGEACGIGMTVISRWIHTIGWDPGLRLRLYLVDLPEGMSVETLAITVVAPEERFEEVIEETKPIIESIEFHTP